MSTTRQLAAIMFTDIVGYTALMGDDEQRAFDLLNKNREIHQPIIKMHKGKLIKELGDGILASFPTVSDALFAAIKIQQACSASKELSLRIGIHEGEIIIENNDIYGDAVNIASRIQTLGIPGSILFSKKVADEIKNKAEFHTVSLGSFEFKNVNDPIEVFALTNDGFPVPKRSMMEGKLKKKNFLKRNIIVSVSFILLAVAAFIIYKKYFINNNDAGIDKSIAVLPFVDMSAGKDQEYFSDGLSEELLNLLSKISELKVIGRTSSFSFKGKNEDLRVIGEKLGVAHILEGSVRKQGNQVKINAKLISVENGYQLWSQQFNRSLDDVFAIQEEIALAITQNLKITLLKNEKLEIGKGLTHSKEAYDAYLKGRHFWYPRRLKESEQFFKQAINVDPSFASAYAGLAVTYVLFPFYRFGTPHESMPKAQEAAEKAIQANSALAEPYASLAWKNFIYDWQPDAAKKYFEKALRINPNYSPVHYWYGQYLAYYASDSTMAIAEMRKGLELDPLDPVAHFSLGVTLKQLNKLNEAIQAFKTAIEFNVEYSNAYVNMGYCYLVIGKADDALKAFNKAAQLSNDWAQAVLIYFYVNNRQHGQAKAAFDELLKRSQIEYIPKSSLAIAASFLGQKDLAHELLKKAFEERDTRLVHYKLFTVPLPKDLLKDPRNMKLFEQFKLPDWR